VNVTIAILGLALLVLVHEAGHFFTAIAVGMRPRKFYVGFPPALVKVTRRGIEYGLGAIPLGGYVRIPGMHRPAPGDIDVHFAPARGERPELTVPLERLKRALTEGNMQAAREEVVGLEELIRLAKLSPGARRLAERGLRELWDGLGPDAYWRQRTWKRIAVIAAGPLTNVVFALLLFTVLFLVAGGPATSRVQTLRDGFPAAQMGLRPGDEIVAIGRTRVTPDTVATAINSSRGRPITVTVVRDGQVLELGPTRPKRDTDGAYRLGFVLDREGLSLPTAAWRSVRLTGLVTEEIGKSLGRLVTGSGREEISSPVGIVQGSSTALDEGAERYLWVLGLLSLSLALLNLLPLLPLDGGHITFSVIEGIRGRAVGREVYERVSAVGLALVLLLFFVGLSNDISRLGE
jgi:regulator of sigma E protease